MNIAQKETRHLIADLARQHRLYGGYREQHLMAEAEEDIRAAERMLNSVSYRILKTEEELVRRNLMSATSDVL